MAVLNYLGNKKLKATGVKQPFTKHQISEIIKCSNDIVYFVQKYMKIVNLDEGLIPFNLRKYQEKTLKSFVDNRNVICLFPRQSGKTVSYCAFILHSILFKDHYAIALLANKAAVAREILSRVKLAYENLPLWLQQGVTEWNKGSIELENGSKAIAGATSDSSGRSGSFSTLILDEFAFVPKNIADEFIKSALPVISSGKTSKIIMVSTCNGMNQFYKFWTDAIKNLNNYVPIEVKWDEVPGRDEAWKVEMIRSFGAGGEEKFKQEFENDFFGSASKTLVDMSMLKKFADNYKQPISSKDCLDIYEEPKETHNYVMTVDTGRGTEDDYSAFVVFDLTANSIKVVAKYRNNEILPNNYSAIIYEIAKKYNDAHILVEINDIGGQVVDSLYHDYSYENIMMTSGDKKIFNRQNLVFSKKNAKFGIRTSKKVKQVGCVELKNLIENNILEIPDFDIISELGAFIQVKGSYEADSGFHDDLAMCLVLFGWLMAQRNFKELLDDPDKYAESKEEVAPFLLKGNPDENMGENRFIADGCVWEVVDNYDRKR